MQKKAMLFNKMVTRGVAARGVMSLGCYTARAPGLLPAVKFDCINTQYRKRQLRLLTATEDEANNGC